MEWTNVDKKGQKSHPTFQQGFFCRSPKVAIFCLKKFSRINVVENQEYVLMRPRKIKNSFSPSVARLMPFVAEGKLVEQKLMLVAFVRLVARP